jgi:hypothetical protein
MQSNLYGYFNYAKCDSRQTANDQFNISNANATEILISYQGLKKQVKAV